MNPILKTTCALLLAALLFAPLAAQAQTPPLNPPPTPELAVTYTWLHTNAPPGGCGCFSLNGGNASFALPFRGSRLSIVAEFTDGYASNVLNTTKSLNLTTYTAGLRYSPLAGHRSRLQPFAEVLLGAAHLNGSLATGSTANSTAAFAGSAGGGLDLRINHRFALRLLQAQYLATTFDNFSNNHQNNVQLGAGVVFHF